MRFTKRQRLPIAGADIAVADRCTAFEGDALNGTGRAWGVHQHGVIVYETMFTEATARRLAQLCDSMPRADWETHRAVLAGEGLDLRDPATGC
jgi:hypothetical protein